MALIPSEILQLERKNVRISAVTTTLLLLILALLTFFFTAYRTPDRPPGKEYKFVGAMDFGDNKQGSRNVNTLERSVADPEPTPPAQAQPQAETNPVQPTPPPPTPVTRPDPRPVSTPTSPPTTRPTQTTQPTTTPTQPTPQPTQPTPAPPTPQPSQELDPNFSMNSGGGANQGNAEPGSVGNSGTPATTVLDPKGMYSFSQGGEGGLNGRKPVSLPYPNYNTQEEGVLEFEFYIEADGSVSYARALPNNKPELAAAGAAAIKKWKFDPVPGAARQKVKVPITFKLRG